MNKKGYNCLRFWCDTSKVTKWCAHGKFFWRYSVHKDIVLYIINSSVTLQGSSKWLSFKIFQDLDMIHLYCNQVIHEMCRPHGYSITALWPWQVGKKWPSFKLVWDLDMIHLHLRNKVPVSCLSWNILFTWIFYK